MLNKDEVEYLATLARISLTDEDRMEFPEKLGAVLSYVSEISKVTTEGEAKDRGGALRNVTRADGNPTTGGDLTARILANAPETEDGYVKVKKII